MSFLQTEPGTSPARQWLGAFALLICAALAGWVLDDWISLVSQSMFFVLAVVVAAYRYDWRVSIVVAVASVAALNFLFVPPRWTFEVDSRDNAVALFLLLVVTLATSHLADRLRRETRAARISEQRARQLQQMAVALSSAESPGDVRDIGRQALSDAFDGESTLYLAGEDDSAFEPSVRDGLMQCMHDLATLGPGTGRWPGLDAWFIPLLEGGEAMGAMRITPALASDVDSREHGAAIAALLAQSLKRIALETSTRQAREQTRHQQLQATFLAGVAHDLRTPLAAIIGAASSLQTQSVGLADEEKSRLLESVIGEARYLTRMADNTLQLTRLQSPDVPIPRSWESMEELVGAALVRARQFDPQRRITATVAPGLPLVMADPILISQLIANLLDNALKYSEGAIALNVAAHADTLQLDVDDCGPRIDAAQRERIFMPHTRGDNTGSHGAGLGLAVCRAIALAHGAQLTVQDNETGGNRFTLEMPVKDAP